MYQTTWHFTVLGEISFAKTAQNHGSMNMFLSSKRLAPAYSMTSADGMKSPYAGL